MDIVTRAEWGARSPKSRRTIDLPTPDLWLHHTAGSEPDGANGVLRVQNFHMDSRGYHDIAYSFVVDRTGTVYEGRGAGVQGAHTSGHNSTAHAICVLGHYGREQAPQAVVDAVGDLVAYGHRQGWWANPYLTGGHRDVGSTSCPGLNLYARIPDINRRAVAAVPLEEQTMNQGDQGPDVAAWQHRLKVHAGIDVAVDGDFGPATVAATKAWQERVGIEPSGSVTLMAVLTLGEQATDNVVTRHAKGPHGGEVDLSGYAKKAHSHFGEITVK